MTILFGGGEIGAFTPNSSSGIESTAGGGFDTGFARCAISMADAIYYGGTQYSADSWEWANQTGDVYTHIDITYDGSDGGSAIVLAWTDAAAADMVRIYNTTNDNDVGVYKLQYLNVSSVWTDAGVTWNASGRETYDVFINVTSGDLAVYRAGTQLTGVGGTGLSLSHITGIAKLRPYSFYGGPRFSQPIVADEPTIGMRLMTVYASGAGTTSDFVGGYGNIDEIVYSDADFIYGTTNGNISLFTGTAVGATTGYVVRAVCVAARAKRGAGGPQNLQLALRVNGSNYTSSSLPLSIGYDSYVNVWNTNPDTTSAWLVADLAALQFGVKAIT